jgi:hypothetical protein
MKMSLNLPSSGTFKLFSCFREKFYKKRGMRRLKFAGRKVYHGGNSSNIL